ncbi:unnamed protein product [Amoebophrya sp. A120]|nr:unnamed protein product [Amoebophrya sp. A120]|eukprot:GSA120T00009844001.1
MTSSSEESSVPNLSDWHSTFVPVSDKELELPQETKLLQERKDADDAFLKKQKDEDWQESERKFDKMQSCVSSGLSPRSSPFAFAPPKRSISLPEKVLSEEWEDEEEEEDDEEELSAGGEDIYNDEVDVQQDLRNEKSSGTTTSEGQNLQAAKVARPPSFRISQTACDDDDISFTPAASTSTSAQKGARNTRKMNVFAAQPFTPLQGQNQRYALSQRKITTESRLLQHTMASQQLGTAEVEFATARGQRALMQKPKKKKPHKSFEMFLRKAEEKLLVDSPADLDFMLQNEMEQTYSNRGNCSEDSFYTTMQNDKHQGPLFAGLEDPGLYEDFDLENPDDDLYFLGENITVLDGESLDGDVNFHFYENDPATSDVNSAAAGNDQLGAVAETSASSPAGDQNINDQVLQNDQSVPSKQGPRNTAATGEKIVKMNTASTDDMSIFPLDSSSLGILTKRKWNAMGTPTEKKKVLTKSQARVGKSIERTKQSRGRDYIDPEFDLSSLKKPPKKTKPIQNQNLQKRNAVQEIRFKEMEKQQHALADKDLQQMLDARTNATDSFLHCLSRHLREYTKRKPNMVNAWRKYLDQSMRGVIARSKFMELCQEIQAPASAQLWPSMAENNRMTLLHFCPNEGAMLFRLRHFLVRCFGSLYNWFKSCLLIIPGNNVVSNELLDSLSPLRMFSKEYNASGKTSEEEAVLEKLQMLEDIDEDILFDSTIAGEGDKDNQPNLIPEGTIGSHVAQNDANSYTLSATSDKKTLLSQTRRKQAFKFRQMLESPKMTQMEFEACLEVLAYPEDAKKAWELLVYLDQAELRVEDLVWLELNWTRWDESKIMDSSHGQGSGMQFNSGKEGQKTFTESVTSTLTSLDVIDSGKRSLEKRRLLDNLTTRNQWTRLKAVCFNLNDGPETMGLMRPQVEEQLHSRLNLYLEQYGGEHTKQCLYAPERFWGHQLGRAKDGGRANLTLQGYNASSNAGSNQKNDNNNNFDITHDPQTGNVVIQQNANPHFLNKLSPFLKFQKLHASVANFKTVLVASSVQSTHVPSDTNHFSAMKNQALEVRALQIDASEKKREELKQRLIFSFRSSLTKFHLTIYGLKIWRFTMDPMDRGCIGLTTIMAFCREMSWTGSRVLLWEKLSNKQPASGFIVAEDLWPNQVKRLRVLRKELFKLMETSIPSIAVEHSNQYNIKVRSSSNSRNGTSRYQQQQDDFAKNQCHENAMEIYNLMDPNQAGYITRASFLAFGRKYLPFLENELIKFMRQITVGEHQVRLFFEDVYYLLYGKWNITREEVMDVNFNVPIGMPDPRPWEDRYWRKDVIEHEAKLKQMSGDKPIESVQELVHDPKIRTTTQWTKVNVARLKQLAFAVRKDEEEREFFKKHPNGKLPGQQNDENEDEDGNTTSGRRPFIKVDIRPEQDPEGYVRRFAALNYDRKSLFNRANQCGFAPGRLSALAKRAAMREPLWSLGAGQMRRMTCKHVLEHSLAAAAQKKNEYQLRYMGTLGKSQSAGNLGSGSREQPSGQTNSTSKLSISSSKQSRLTDRSIEHAVIRQQPPKTNFSPTERKLARLQSLAGKQLRKQAREEQGRQKQAEQRAQENLDNMSFHASFRGSKLVLVDDGQMQAAMKSMAGPAALGENENAGTAGVLAGATAAGKSMKLPAGGAAPGGLGQKSMMNSPNMMMVSTAANNNKTTGAIDFDQLAKSDFVTDSNGFSGNENAIVIERANVKSTKQQQKSKQANKTILIHKVQQQVLDKKRFLESAKRAILDRQKFMEKLAKSVRFSGESSGTKTPGSKDSADNDPLLKEHYKDHDWFDDHSSSMKNFYPGQKPPSNLLPTPDLKTGHLANLPETLGLKSAMKNNKKGGGQQEQQAVNKQGNKKLKKATAVVTSANTFQSLQAKTVRPGTLNQDSSSNASGTNMNNLSAEVRAMELLDEYENFSGKTIGDAGNGSMETILSSNISANKTSQRIGEQTNDVNNSGEDSSDHFGL